MNTHKNLQLFSTILRGITVITLVLTNFVGGFSISNVSAQTMTISIRDDATGGDCTTIGEWDSDSKTCSLTANLNNVVITIASDGVTLDGAGYVLSGDASIPKGIVVTEHSYVTLKRLKVTGYQTGISLFYANSNTIDGNSTYDNSSVGISVYSSHNNIVRNNISENNGSTGIRLDWSTYNTIQDNIASGHTGYPRGGMFIFSGTHHNTIENNNISDNYYGIYVHDSANSNTIQDNALTNNFYGVAVTASSNNLIQSNLASGNYAGIDLGSNARTNTIQQNEITGGTWGISLNSSGAPTSSGSSDNVVTENTVSASSMAGIQIDRSVNNQIYRNNFLGSGAHNNDGSGNTFDAGLELGGNYWISYDEPSEGCTNANSDAYCDSPYLLPAGYQDNYPWARQNGWLNQPPVANAGGPYSTFTGDAMTLDASASSDPDGDALTYAWDFDNNGQYDDATGVTVTTTFSQAGEYTVGLRVTDTLGLEGTDTAIVTVTDHTPNGSFAAHLPGNQVHAYNWTAGSTLTLTIDDPEIPGSPDFQGAEVVPDNDLYGNTWTVFELPEFELKPGQTMTITDNITTKTHVIRTVAVASVNPDTDIITGTAESNTEVGINAHYNPGGDYVHRNIISDENGIWTVDLSIPGPNSGEDRTYDIIGGSWGTAFQLDDDNDSTFYEWRVPKDPQVQVVLNHQEVHCSFWPFGAELTLTIDDPDNGVGVDYLITHPVDQISDDETFALFTLRGQYEIQPGDIVMVTDGATTKQHTVYHLDLTSLDPETNVLTGTATPGQTVKAYTWGSQNGQCSTTVSWVGDWAINFSDPACEQPYDLQLGSEGALLIEDPNNTATQYFWRVANPRIFAIPNEEQVHAWGWLDGTLLTLTIDNPATPQSPDYTATQAAVSSEEWDHAFELSGIFDIQPGYLVAVSGGGFTKELVVAPLTVTAVDIDADTVSGTGDPGFEIHVGMLCDDNGCTRRNVYVDNSGNWIADFSVPGNNEDETVFDIRPGSGTGVYQIDEDNDATNVEWHVPNPTFGVRANDNNMEGWEWPLGVTVTIEIDDPNTIETNPDYTGTATVVVADWDPNQTLFRHNIENYDVKAGDTVKVTDGNTTKLLNVIDFMIVNVDLDTDKVYGIAEPGQHVNVWTCWQNDPCISRDETAGGDGNWETDFSIPGEQDWESETADLRARSWIDSSVTDEDGDQIMFGWYVPNPSFSARFHENEIHGYEWLLGTAVTMTIDDPNTPQSVDYVDTQTVVVADWDPNQTFVQFRLWENNFELENGQIVTMSDGTMTKTHIVAVPTITNIIDYQSSVEGLTEPTSEIWVDFSGATRHETSDVNGHWLADFSVPGDEDFETQTVPPMYGYPTGEARYQDEDGDSTSINWGTGRMLLELDRDGTPRDVYLRHWPGRLPVTLMVDDPATPQNPDYTDTQTMYWSDGYSHLTINWTGIFAVRPGFSITVTDGYIARSMIVPLLAITGYDVVNDTISGISDPFATITVPVSHESGPEYVEPTVTADSDGNWVVDLAIPSYPNNEIYDLQPGDYAEPQEHDADWNETVLRDWSVPDQPLFAPFVVFGQEGVWFKENTEVMSGDVGANIASDGPYLTDQSEVTIGQGVKFLDPASRVMGDTVYLKHGSQVYDVYNNQLKGQGQILGVNHTPLELPLIQQLPTVPNVSPGTQNFDLKKNSTLTLDAGSYGKLETKKGAVITFTGGVYHFSEWSLGDDVKLYFATPTEIRIADKLDIGSDAFIGPAIGTNLTARDILIYVMGENGKKGKINNSPKAANFGMKTTLIANVYAPNGTLWIHERSTATGAFFGKWVEIGQNVTLTLENGWR